ncbi:MAG: copper resistance protein NlpE [Hymenobacteraceae bacterium]|nr:copper resistance protein NlpE [Hymenobacteraceae bacterium]
MEKILSSLLIAALYFNVAPEKKAAAVVAPPYTFVQSSVQKQVINRSLGTYKGTVPCADCEGIQMELTLQENPAGKGKTYVLRQTYKGKPAGENTLESRGKWFAANGNKQNPKAVIFQLIPDGEHDLLYFARVSDNTIKMLDRQQNEIKSKASYTLQKQRQ